MRSIRRTEAQSAYRSAISPRYKVLRRGAGECGAFVVSKHYVLTALPSLQDIKRLSHCRIQVKITNYCTETQ